MTRAEPKERYLIKIDSKGRTINELSSRVVDTPGSSLERSDIMNEISNKELLTLSERVRGIYYELLAEARREFPDKLRLVYSPFQESDVRSPLHLEPFKTLFAVFLNRKTTIALGAP